MSRTRPTQLVPFSAGPAQCPGRNLVLFATSALAANLLSRLRFELRQPAASADEPLPMTLNQSLAGGSANSR
ncbi:hypothetical protein [Mycolicibacterium sp. XJ870]